MKDARGGLRAIRVWKQAETERIPSGVTFQARGWGRARRKRLSTSVRNFSLEPCTYQRIASEHKEITTRRAADTAARNRGLDVRLIPSPLRPSLRPLPFFSSSRTRSYITRKTMEARFSQETFSPGKKESGPRTVFTPLLSPPFLPLRYNCFFVTRYNRGEIWNRVFSIFYLFKSYLRIFFFLTS